MSRISIRLRLTLGFAAGLALLLGVAGLFLYFRFKSQLDATIDQGLHARARDIAALVRRSGGGAEPGRRGLLAPTERFAQVLDLSGRILSATPSTRGRTLLDPVELERARSQTVLFYQDEEARILATPARL